MKDEKANYLMVDSNEIEKTLFEMKRIFEFNDGYNAYFNKGKVFAKNFFEKNNIPEKFQKIIIKINISFFGQYDGEEFILRMPFDLTGRKIEKINKEKYLNATSRPILYDDNRFENFIEFKTKLKKVKYEEVLTFLKELKNEGYLEAYINSLKSFFDINIKINYEINDEDVLETIKEYKLKYLYNNGIRIDGKKHF